MKQKYTPKFEALKIIKALYMNKFNPYEKNTTKNLKKLISDERNLPRIVRDN